MPDLDMKRPPGGHQTSRSDAQRIVIDAARERARAIRHAANNPHTAGGIAVESPTRGVMAWQAARKAEADGIEAAIRELEKSG